MRVVVTGRHVEVPDEVRDYIEKKADKLPRFYDRIHDVEVVLGHESEQFTIEIIVRVDNKHTFVASEVGSDTFVLVDSIMDKIERQLNKHKEKVRNHKHDNKTDVFEQG